MRSSSGRPVSTTGSGCSTSAPAPATPHPRRPHRGRRGGVGSHSRTLRPRPRTRRQARCAPRLAGGGREALPFADDEFDVVLSCVGVMFAPHHQAGADEMVRVCKPGGTIGLLSWTPDGFIGRMFAAMKPYAPPPPPGAQPPPRWGDEAHVRELLGDRVTDVTAQRDTVRSTTSTDPTRFRDYFKANYGPTIAVYKRYPAIRTRLRRSIATSPTWPESSTSVTARSRWTGSTCCSPRTSAPDPEARCRASPVTPWPGE